MLGAAFFVVMIVMSLNVILFAMGRYDTLMADSFSAYLLQEDRMSERPTVSDVRVDNSKLNATVKNLGKIPLKIVTLWATQWTGNASDWHRRFELDVYLAPGQTQTNIGQNLAQSVDRTKTYQVKFVTTRGVIASAAYVPLRFSIAPSFINTGYLTIAFSDDSFKYTKAGSATLRTAWDPPATDTCVVWHVQFVNHGAQDIKLYKFSVLSFVKAQSAAKQIQYFIVHPNVVYVNGCSQRDSVTPYPSTPIQLIPMNSEGDSQAGGPPVWVKFSAITPGGDKPQSGSWSPGDEYVVFIVMFYQYGPTETYTQVIPFAGVHFV